MKQITSGLNSILIIETGIQILPPLIQSCWYKCCLQRCYNNCKHWTIHNIYTSYENKCYVNLNNNNIYFLMLAFNPLQLGTSFTFNLPLPSWKEDVMLKKQIRNIWLCSRVPKCTIFQLNNIIIIEFKKYVLFIL